MFLAGSKRFIKTTGHFERYSLSFKLEFFVVLLKYFVWAIVNSKWVFNILNCLTIVSVGYIMGLINCCFLDGNK